MSGWSRLYDNAQFVRQREDVLEPLSPEEFDAIAFLMREAGATLIAMDAAEAHRLREENLALQARLALHT
jgi:hypothetical protein